MDDKKSRFPARWCCAGCGESVDPRAEGVVAGGDSDGDVYLHDREECVRAWVTRRRAEDGAKKR